MKAFRGIMFSWLFSATIVAALYCVFALATAKADPGDSAPIEAVAHQVCTDLYDSPSVATFDSIVNGLFAAGNTDTQEHKVMAYAMQVACPEFMPIAKQWVKDTTHTNRIGGRIGA